ncbi:MAG: molybdopterin synthase sulfur carrier subunit [Gammaproteobacteria bacterium]|nr:MAG: molybdopterin synthase sulfur carrier subunit [Gammaproteobacteria bacterium]
MKITVKFFGNLAEKVNLSQVELDIKPNENIKNIWNRATDNYDLEQNILVAIDGDYAKFDDTAKDGDEIAFFPPVTGG